MGISILQSVFRAGKKGLVPAPAAADTAKLLRGDGTWVTAMSAFKGGVAGASVAATATAAGDWYVITADGTSQSITWTKGDAAIYNGSSGSWTRVAGVLSGVDTTALQAADQQLADRVGVRVGADYLMPDGVTTYRRCQMVPGAVGAVAGLPIWVRARFRVPETNYTGATWAVWQLSSNAAGGANGSLGVTIEPSGELRVTQEGIVAGVDRRRLTMSGFRAAYSGRWVDMLFYVPGGGTVTSGALVWVNGSLLSLTSVEVGDVPPWAPSYLATAYMSAALNAPATPVLPVEWGIGSPTQADADYIATTGRLPAWMAAPASAVNRITGTSYTFASGVGTWIALNSATLLADAANGQLDVSGELGAGAQIAITTVVGRRYRVTIAVRNLSLGAGVDGLIAQTEGTTRASGIAANGLISFEYTAASAAANLLVRLPLAAAASSWSLAAPTFTDLGAVSATVVQPTLTLRDTSGNGKDWSLLSVSPVTQSKDWVIRAEVDLTTGAGSAKQLFGAAVFVDATETALEDAVWIRCAGAGAVVSVGDGTTATRYSAAVTLVAGLNRIPLSATPWPADAAKTSLYLHLTTVSPDAADTACGVMVKGYLRK